jgi:hypothetical protein
VRFQVIDINVQWLGVVRRIRSLPAHLTIRWRTLKHEEVYLHGYDSVSAATTGIGRYLTLYDTRRPRSSLADRTPDEAYFTPLPLRAAA